MSTGPERLAINVAFALIEAMLVLLCAGCASGNGTYAEVQTIPLPPLPAASVQRAEAMSGVSVIPTSFKGRVTLDWVNAPICFLNGTPAPADYIALVYASGVAQTYAPQVAGNTSLDTITATASFPATNATKWVTIYFPPSTNSAARVVVSPVRVISE